MTVRNENDWLTATDRRRGRALMNVKGQEYIGLDEVGADIWTILQTPHSVNEVCAAIARQYQIAPETCRADVERVVRPAQTAGRRDRLACENLD